MRSRLRYGHTTALMSVDHKYDSLWEDQDGRSQVILLPDDDSDGELLPGAFSMLVTAAMESESRDAEAYMLIISRGFTSYIASLASGMLYKRLTKVKIPG